MIIIVILSRKHIDKLTKTGSGQASEKLRKQRRVFLQGASDDFNKCLWSALYLEPTTSADEVVAQYARHFLGGGSAAAGAALISGCGNVGLIQTFRWSVFWSFWSFLVFLDFCDFFWGDLFFDLSSGR